jgi:hypothetical protein
VEILFKLFMVVGGIIAQPSLRSKAMVDKPNGHIGNEMPQVAEINVKLSFIMYSNLNMERKKVLFKDTIFYIVLQLALTLSAVENISQCSKE